MGRGGPRRARAEKPVRPQRRGASASSSTIYPGEWADCSASTTPARQARAPSWPRRSGVAGAAGQVATILEQARGAVITQWRCLRSRHVRKVAGG